MPFSLATVGIVIALVIVILYNTIKILKEYERGVVFFLGRFQTVKGPGLIILIPTSAFKGKEQTLDPNPALRFIGVFDEEAAAPPAPTMKTASAEGDLPPPKGHSRPIPSAGRSWIGAIGALIIAAALALYFVL